MKRHILKDIINDGKKTATLRTILSQFINQGASTIPETARLLDLSIPTVTKVVNELMDIGLLQETGKREIAAGRVPVVYDLVPSSGYFLGIDPGQETLSVGISDFCGNIIESRQDIPYRYANTPECLDGLIESVRTFLDEASIDRDLILNACMTVSGRVNPAEGQSYSLFTYLDKPLAQVLTEGMGLPVCIDNDTRCMTYGEFVKGACRGKKDVVFVNMSWGLGMGIIIDGKLYFGKSGYSGEIGHMRTYNNGIVCHCGKIGCMETEVSGRALQREMTQRLLNGEQSVLTHKVTVEQQPLTLADLLDAICHEDTVCIDALQKIADELGKNLAGIINVFNPEMLVIGGDLSVTNDYLTLPVSMGIKKYSLNIVNEDSKIATSQLKDRAGLVGACVMARYQMLKS